MKTYQVVFSVEVEAENKFEASDLAFQTVVNGDAEECVTIVEHNTTRHGEKPVRRKK